MKLPLVSVIVPTKNSAEFLDACLKSITSQTYRNIELIVVDNFSTDNTPNIARTYTSLFYQRGPERSAQRNYGAKKSHGQFLLFIDSDMELTNNVVEACVSKLEKSSAKAIIIPEESFGEGFWAQCKKLERSFYVGVDWMEAARFFKQKTFEDFSGYDEQNTGTEDYDLPQRIVAIHGKETIERVDVFIRHNEQRISLYKTCKKKFYYAQRLQVYSNKQENKVNFAKQVSPLQRYKLFFSNPRSLLKNPFLACGLFIMKTTEYAAGAIGYLSKKEAGLS